MAVVAVAAGVLGLSACAAINQIKNAIHDVRGNKAVIDGFNSKLNAAPRNFQVVYTTSISSPATVTNAEHLPDDVAFTLTPTKGSANTAPVHLVQNSSGEYACDQTAGQWNCEEISGTSAATQNALIDLYTPGTGSGS